MAISSINVKPVKSGSEAHNQRGHEMAHVYPVLTKNNQTWQIDTIASRRRTIEDHCKKTSGRKLQKNATPIREAVVNLNPEHNIDDLKRLAGVLQDEFRIEVFQAYIHRDEGHLMDDGTIRINHHAHLVIDWQDKEKGKMRRLGKLEMVRLQTVVAETLGMERGKEGSQAVRLEAQAYKAAQAEKTAVLQKNEAEAATALAQKTGLVADFGLNPGELNWHVGEYKKQQRLNADTEKLKQATEKLNAGNEKSSKRLAELSAGNKKLSRTFNKLVTTLEALKTKLKRLLVRDPRGRDRGGMAI